MARIRTIKPEFFRNYKLYQAEKEENLPLRLAFAGLWTTCDREGRFKWVPEMLKLDCLPYDECDFSRVLDALWTRGYINKYALTESETDEFYGFVPTWNNHQIINNRETKSNLPNPHECYIMTRGSRVLDASMKLLSGREGKGREKEREIHVDDAQVCLVYPFDSENFKIWWDRWKEYKKKEHKFSYASEISEQAALKKLAKISCGDENKAIAIVEESIANGWEGLFPEQKSTKNSKVPDSYKQQVLDEIR
jgi:hypothetical protein